MKKNSVKIKLVILLFLAIGIIAIFSFLILDQVTQKENDIYNKSEINKVRILTKDVSKTILNVVKGEEDKGTLENILKEKNMGLIIVDKTGGELFTYGENIEKFKSLKESLYMDSSYISTYKDSYKISYPIVHKEEVVGYSIFYLDKNQVYEKIDKNIIIRLIIIEIVLLVLIIFIGFNILKKKIFNPIYKLNKAAEKINKGDYDFEISYGKDEIGEFAANFEKMRDDLCYTLGKEKELEEGRKELIAAISHDIRTPLSSISAYVEAIKSGVAKDEERLNKYIDIIDKKTKELKDLVSDLFTHSQIETDKLSINKEEVYFRDYINDILEPVINETINFKISSLIPNKLVNIDERRIGQVFLNIIENSKKYSNGKGVISISFKTLEDEIRVRIEDEGIGIAPEDMPYIFDKFYRGEKSRNKSYGGAGLGLSICKTIIEAHGGEIWINSKEGEGTKIYFTIKTVDNY